MDLSEVDLLESKLCREFPAHFPVLVLEYGREFCGEEQVPCVSQGCWAVLCSEGGSKSSACESVQYATEQV